MAYQPANRERRLRQVFGEVLPEISRDDLEDQGQQPVQARDQWLLDNCPPHHDGPA